MVIYDSRLVLIYLAIKYDGDYDKIALAIQLKEDPPAEEVVKVCESLKCHAVTLLDYDYPLVLKEIYRPPFVLFYYGDISLLKRHDILAVVGARENNEYGKYCTEKIVSKVAPGRVIVSGLARGIDAIAHQCAIDNGGRTIAVLGSGIDYCYPPENQALYEEIKKNHLVISEYPGVSSPSKNHFPMRNRIVTGLAEGIYIPQINDYMSGTMISVSQSLNLGKMVFVSPDQIDKPTINNQLIDEGAIFTIDGETIMVELEWRN